jgi:hypothetical protein
MLQWIEEYETWSTSLSQAILRKFSSAALDIPLEVLRQHLAKNFLDVYSVHPQTFERLIAAVLRDFFSLHRVEHCGRSHDGGIDAFVVDGEHKMIVQVKRRKSPKSAESVTTVRQVFGVLFRDELREAMIVTTADRFSAEAQEEVRGVLKRGLCDSFELVDAKRLFDMLELTQKAIKPVWAQGLRGIVEENGEERAIQLIAGGLAECFQYGNDAVRQKYEAIRNEERTRARITYGAYGRWLERSRAGLPGDALSDWLAAEQDAMRSER